MRLRDLFSDEATIDPQAEAVVVTGLAVDSRAVRPGDLFFALAGSKTDGAGFIDSAIASGAVAVAGDHPPQGACRVPFVATPNPRRALALAAAKFYPRQPATIVAVTGTSGKTSVTAFTRQIWQRLGHASASIGTIGLVSEKRTIYGSLTTPDPIALHRQLDEIAAEGVTHLAFEASSHGLDQYRLDGVRVSAGGFTNLTRDHMDYHPDVAHYLAAKLRLFRDLVAADGAAVIRNWTSNIAGAGMRSGCRWSANSRSRTRWSQRVSRSVPAASPKRFSPSSNFSKAPRAGWSKSPSATARRSLSIMPTSPMRWQRRCRRCGLTPNASSLWCSGQAATVMPANVR
jgi:UDP-N-acetylmuramyl tripeptide synthase